MRKIREITSEEENFRAEPFAKKHFMVKRDSIQPEPIGTIILIPFKIIGYDQDCDGSLMARLTSVNLDYFDEAGWEVKNIGLYPNSGFVMTKKELKELAEKARGAL